MQDKPRRGRLASDNVANKGESLVMRMGPAHKWFGLMHPEGVDLRRE